jgi:predicted negative regulator of RcsB-dependent stress response
MAELQTDEEKVEAIKKWWKENGVSVIAGVAIGLGAVFGWRAWVSYHTSVAQRASIAFEQLLATTAADQRESAEKQAEILDDDFGGTPYAMFSDLALAKVRLEAGDRDGAIDALQSAIDRAPEPGLATLASLRLARVLIDAGELERASKLIDAQDADGAFSADLAALRGDIAVAQGRTDAARAAYRQAIDDGAAEARLIELKLRELPTHDAG